MKYESWAVEELLAEAGRRIRQERLNRDLTQQELAERAGISPETLKTIESGAGNPTLRVVLLVLRALGLLDRFDGLLPEPGLSPVQAAKLRKEQRERASGSRSDGADAEGVWEW